MTIRVNSRCLFWQRLQSPREPLRLARRYGRMSRKRIESHDEKTKQKSLQDGSQSSRACTAQIFFWTEVPVWALQLSIRWSCLPAEAPAGAGGAHCGDGVQSQARGRGRADNHHPRHAGEHGVPCKVRYSRRLSEHLRQDDWEAQEHVVYMDGQRRHRPQGGEPPAVLRQLYVFRLRPLPA